MDRLAELLRQGADKLVNFPTEAQRFITNPQAFTQLLTGKNPMPRETGFAAGATGLPAQQGTVLDPEYQAYLQGYEQGEPFGYAAMATPLVVPVAKALAPKAGQMAENYMFNQGMMPSIVPPNPTKVAEALRQPLKNELGFYSPLDEAVMNLQNPKGTGQQYLAQLLKTQGVKQEEVSTRGLDTFLTNNPKVTKTQIEDFLGQNPVKLKETTLAEPKNEWQGNFLMMDRTAVAKIEENADGMYVLRDTMTNKVTPLDASQLDQAVKKAEEIYGVRGDVTPYGGKPKFGDYTLPNGENYREVLIQYPNTKTEKFDPSKVEIVRNRPSVTQGTYTIKYNGKEVQTYGDEFNAKDNYKGLSDDEIMQTAKKLFEEGNKFQKIKPMANNFMSSHFDEPNILAHMRVNDRTIDGKKTLFVEEIQSDWHQAGRKKGYGEKDVPAPTTMKVKEYINPYVNNKGESFSFGVVDNGQLVSGNFRTEAEALAEIERLRGTVKQMGVPDAPFKKNWQELAMKRAMQMAAEGGYDRVAFTTGKQQADRFNLRKNIEELHYSGSDLVAYNNNGEKVITRTGVKPEDLPDLIGKEAAEKLLKQPKQGTLQSLTGQDLEVGGEGMKGFYDKILPDFVNKYGKKNGLKVGKTKMRTSTDKQATEDAKLLNDLGVSKNGPNAYEEVHYFDLTPEAKESFLKKGQPLFAVPPAMAITDEDSRRDMLEKLFNNQK